jgi:sporulation integral membrane protein YtvI
MRKQSSMLIIIGVLALIVAVIYFGGGKLLQEVKDFMLDSPEIYRTMEETFTTAGDKLQGLYDKFPESVQMGLSDAKLNLDQTMGNLIASISQPTVDAAGSFATKLPSIMIATIVALVSAYFFIAQREQVLEAARRIVPEPIARRGEMVMDGMKYAVGGYFKAQLKIMCVIAVILLIGFLIMGVHYAVLVCILVAFMDFLPFFGTGTILIPWALIAFLTGDYRRVVGLIILYIVTLIAHQVIQPKMIGDTLDMNPLLTLFFLYLGYKMGGIIWMILAVPIGMIVINLYKAGAFDYILDDVKILIHGALDLRKNE